MFAWRDNYISYNGSGTNPTTDPYWTSVSYLENYELAQYTYSDQSSYNFPVTVASTSESLYSPFTQPSGSVFFNGSSTWLVTPYNNPASVLGTNNFTMECWVYCTSNTGFGEIMAINLQGGSYAAARVVHVNGAIYFLCSSSAGSWINGTNVGGAVTTGSWIHFAAVRNGNNFNLYKNGTSIINYSSSASLYNASGQSTIAGMLNQSFTGNFVGYFSNVRFVNGTAVYTSNFTPPTSPLTVVPNTTLLLTFTNQGFVNNLNTGIIDQSKNMFTVTKSSTSPYFSPDTPFNNTYPGSIQFTSANSTYLQVATNSVFTYGSNPMTMECWVKFTTVSSSIQYIIDQRNAGVAAALIPRIYLTAGNKFAYSCASGGSGFTLTGTTTVSAGTWYHVAACVTNTGTTVLYVNGTSEANNSTPIVLAASRVTIGSEGDTVGNYLNGVVSNVRLTNNFAYYNTNFVPSTTPLTVTSNTSLLISGNTSGFNELSTQHNITSTAGGVITNQLYKFGTQSGQYSGTASLINNSTSLQLGSGAFTIEGWFYVTTVGSTQYVMSKGGTNSGLNPGWIIQINSSNQLLYIVNGVTIITSTATISVNTWTYFAITRSGTTCYMFINGTLQTTGTSSQNFTESVNMYVGGNGSSSLTGYMDDVRITKGVCRYTSTFTAPTTPFPTK